MGFLDPAWASKKDEQKAISAAQKITEQEILSRIVREAYWHTVRLAAVEKINNQEVLAYAASNDENDYVRKAAYDKLRAMLIDLVINGNSYESLMALEKLTDQKAFVELVKRVDDSVLRRSIVSKIADQDMLTDIANNDTCNAVRFTAAIKLTDRSITKKIMEDIAQNDKDAFLRREAKDRLKEFDCIGGGVHNWQFDRHDNYLNGDTMNEFDVYICKTCGRVKETNQKSYSW